MHKDINDLVSNHLELDESSIWVLDRTKKFGYSDGVDSEKYLRKVISEATDISSNSYELEKSIKDWNSEYHLSRKRAQLLKGFNYDRSKKVLEVGCGCGAITRFLGETFDNVTAIEGSIARAGIARMRTRDLDNVSIICAPFQEIKFKEKFDIIFCIGVFEYSQMFVDAANPYDHILGYFNEILNPGGEIVIAIENQFGLKYFTSSPEDHSSVMYDGIEGYPRFGNRNAKTFGYNELSSLINRYFQSIQFYFPFPDYKMPSCIVSEDFLHRASVGELVGNFNKQTSYLNEQKPSFDEKLVLLELDKNKVLHFFSNSFLIFASKDDIFESKLDQLGLMYSQDRLKEFHTITEFKLDLDGIIVDKKLASNPSAFKSHYLTLQPTKTEWINDLSIHTQIMKGVKNRGISLDELFAPAKVWFNQLKELSTLNNGEYILDGKYLDSTWTNTFIVNGHCRFIDQEWEWNGDVKLNRMVIKSIFDFLNTISSLNDINPIFMANSKASIIRRISTTFGVQLRKADFDDFVDMESKIAETVYGETNKSLWISYMKLELHNKIIASSLLLGRNLFKKLTGKADNFFRR